MGNNKGRSKGCVTCLKRRVKCGKFRHFATNNYSKPYNANPWVVFKIKTIQRVLAVKRLDLLA